MKIIKLLYRTLILVSAASITLLSFAGLRTDDNNNKRIQILKSTVTDFDGNIYQTVKIGTQVWMVENLKVTHYRDGTPIPNIYDNDQWPHAINGAYCMVNNDSAEYKEAFGLLYNFYAVSNNHMLAPEGWHIPTKEECMKLIIFLGGKDVAGGKIKDNSTLLWISEDAHATNSSGFSGLPAGGRGKFGSAGEVGFYATWWSSTSSDSLYAWHWGLYPDKDGIRSNPGHKASGFSVRCIRN
ncbi:fibrobacter succinogenes major paralogous domain-containing protein [candidate division KSB1 bacterium]